jgi:prolyl-tRNA synthetase
MYYSKLFGKTIKQAPKDSDTANHHLLTQAGFVDQLMAGVYSYLPLGLRVLRKIESIIREEMNLVGGQEVLMPILHPSEIWKTTGAWDKVDVLFKIKSRTERDYALGQSEEEVVTPLVMSRAVSYKDLPIAVYQIHWKYRDELRAKSGIMRGREFLMKDMYSFHESQEDFLDFYETVKQAYITIYKRLGLVAKVTEASGGSFSEKISYEFMVLTDAGEDDILYCENCNFCVNAEIAKIKQGDRCSVCAKDDLKLGRASEVGNVFDLGQKYGKDFDLGFINQMGDKQFPFMGCYGIGVSRVMGVIVEKLHDDKGIMWPESVAPFKVHLIALGKETETYQEAEKLYQQLIQQHVEVLYDDRRETSAGEKFADADLIGIPYRLVMSKKTLVEQAVEVKKRAEAKVELISCDKILSYVK